MRKAHATESKDTKLDLANRDRRDRKNLTPEFLFRHWELAKPHKAIINDLFLEETSEGADRRKEHATSLWRTKKSVFEYTD